MLALAPMMPLTAFSGTASGLLLREQRYRLMSMRLLVGQPIALAAGLGMAAAGYGPWAMVVNQCVATVITFLLLLRGGNLKLRPRLDVAALRDPGRWPGRRWPASPSWSGATGCSCWRWASSSANRSGGLPLRLPAAGCRAGGRLADGRPAGDAAALRAAGRPPALAEAYGELAQIQALLGLPIAAGLALIAPELVRACSARTGPVPASAAQVAGAP